MPLSPSQLIKLKRWNTPSIANALEQVSSVDPLKLVNLAETRDYMPELGVMVGYAMTVVISGGDARVRQEQPENFRLYREYLASRPGPKIVVVRDIDRPQCYGSIWGEVGATHARALGCVGTITDGAVRDLDEMRGVGFKALARRCAVSHAHCWPVEWGGEVEVFGARVSPGQLIHADQHGFIIIPDEAQEPLLEATRFMDDNECDTVIAAGADAEGRSTAELLQRMQRAGEQFSAETRRRFAGNGGEW